MMCVRILSVSFLLFVGVLCSDFQRDIKTKYSCKEDGTHVVYSRGVSKINKNDIVHYVISVGKVGPPTILFIQTNGSDASLEFNCSNILSRNMTDRQNGMRLKGAKAKKVFSAGFIAARLWEYNDTVDAANMSHSRIAHNLTLWRRYPMEQFVWQLDSSNIENNPDFVFTTNSTSHNASGEEVYEEMVSNLTTPKPTSAPKSGGLFKNGGKISFRFVLSGKETRRQMQPRLLFTGNSSQLDLTLDNLNPTFNGSRFAVTFIQMSSLEHDDAAMTVTLNKSVDDEFTPGIFKMYNWQATPKTDQPSTQHDRSFLQWKPVCYVSRERKLSASQMMYNYKPLKDIDPEDLTMMDSSIAYPWFNPKSRVRNPFEAQPMNISFGQSKDGFYVATNYTAWSASMGLGDPPMDSVSILVILIIVIGLGLPFVIIIAGFTAVLVRRRRSGATRSSSYQAIN